MILIMTSIFMWTIIMNTLIQKKLTLYKIYLKEIDSLMINTGKFNNYHKLYMYILTLICFIGISIIKFKLDITYQVIILGLKFK